MIIRVWIYGVPFSLVGRAGVPCTEALSSLGGPGSESRPGAPFCLSLPLSLILFPVISSAVLTIIKPYKSQKFYPKKNKECGFMGWHNALLTLWIVLCHHPWPGTIWAGASRTRLCSKQKPWLLPNWSVAKQPLTTTTKGHTKSTWAHHRSQGQTDSRVVTTAAEGPLQRWEKAFGLWLHNWSQNERKTSVRLLQAAVKAADERIQEAEVWVHLQAPASEGTESSNPPQLSNQENLPVKSFSPVSYQIHWTKTTAQHILKHWSM